MAKSIHPLFRWGRLTLLSLSLGAAFWSSMAQATVQEWSQCASREDLQAQPWPELPHLRVESAFQNAGLIVAGVLPRAAYEKLPLDATMAERIIKAYFKRLDPQRLFFLADDVAHFSQHPAALADSLKQGQLDWAFSVFTLYRDRLIQRYEYVLALLHCDFDFTREESYHFDRKDSPWPETLDQAQQLWRQRVKNDYLRLLLNQKSDQDIRRTLLKRYTNNRNQLLKMNSEDVAEFFLNAYTESTDPHTAYFSEKSKEDFDVRMSLSVEGIGAVLQKRDEYGQIREVVAGGPAALSGQIFPGDRLVAIGQGDDGPMEDVLDARLDDIVKKVRGKRGSVVRLELIPAEGGLDAPHKMVRLVRDKVLLEDQAARSKVIQAQVGGKDYSVGIITIPSFYEDFSGKHAGQADYKSLTTDVQSILQQYKDTGVQAVVFDLRNNGGGSLKEAANLSGLLLGKGQTIVQVRNATGGGSAVRSQVDRLWDKPVVVVVNRVSASASEIFAAAMQDYSRGVVVGDPTWGKGTVQTFRPLVDFLRNPDGYERLGALKWTIQKFFRVNGSSTQLIGVTPDIAFPHSFDHDNFGESSYENVMPWSEIAASRSYKAYPRLAEGLKALKERHEARVASSPNWQLLLDETAHAQTLAKRQSYSLLLSERQAERSKQDAIYQSFAQRRKALGEGEVRAFKLDDGLAAGEGNLKQELAEEKERKAHTDVVAREAAHIAADMVHLSHWFRLRNP